MTTPLLPPHRAGILLDRCLEHASEICARLNQLVGAGLDDLKDINFPLNFENIESELRFLAGLLPQFSEQMLAHLLRLLQTLDQELQTACSRLELYQAMSRSSPSLAMGIRSQWTMEIKEDFKCLNEKMDKWQNSFLQRLFLILLLGKPFSAAETPSKSSDFAALQDLCNLRNAMRAVIMGDVQKNLYLNTLPSSRTRLPHSNLWIPQDDINCRIVIELKEIDPVVELRASKKAINDLAVILSEANPLKMGILQCQGFSRSKIRPNYLELVHNFPVGLENPRSLRELLIDESNKRGPLHSISDRFEFSKQLARAVLYVHTTGYVHKSIRPDTIIVFEEQNAALSKRYPKYLGRPYLTGFDQLRKDGPHSNRASDGEWYKDLYRHPTRQGLNPEKVYSMRHDIYSLGVVLLEVALWTSFVRWDESCLVYMSNEYSCKLLEKENTKASGQKLKSPQDILNVLLKTAERQVRLSMGDKFADVIISCLKSVDGNSLGPLGDFEDEDEVEVGIKYIDLIIEKLEKLSV